MCKPQKSQTCKWKTIYNTKQRQWNQLLEHKPKIKEKPTYTNKQIWTVVSNVKNCNYKQKLKCS
jgi:hypothetical protein